MTVAANPQLIRTRCCVVGGGPAGMMLGLLLARAGVDVTVLEKHGDFLRDFRGDTIHPSTLELMHELGILDGLLQRPHSEARQLDAQIGDERLTVADFTHLPTHCKFIAFMPQWEFLDFIAEQARRYPGFHLLMRTEAADLVWGGGRVTGVRAVTAEGEIEVVADLVVGADGRSSLVRDKAGLLIENLGAPIDVLWLRLSRAAGDPQQSLGRIDAGRVLVMIDRRDYWQCGYVIRKGSFEQIQQRGLQWFRDDLASVAPFVRERVGELRNWDDIKLLTVRVDRLRQWYRPGLLCIGDAAHAMSPVGGVGINLAIQDAVAAANILNAPLRAASVTPEHLRQVQARRELPARITQRLQVLVQERIIGGVLGSRERPRLPLPLKLIRRFPILRRIPARLVGIGFRPEHIQSPMLAPSAAANT